MPFEWNWLRGALDDLLERETFAAVKLVLNGHAVTKLYDRLASGERDCVHVALYPLALALAENWWSVLYEPRKSDDGGVSVEAHHALDACMNGFVFPGVSLWSAGDEALVFDISDIQPEFSGVDFLPPQSRIFHEAREAVEQNLFDLVESVAARVSRKGEGARLHEAWERVRTSLGDREEHTYCLAAGRLGMDPYDPDSIDLTELASGLSDHLFSDICEAATLEELPDAAGWTREGMDALDDAPEISLEGFPALPPLNPRRKVWEQGYEAARRLRGNLGMDSMTPRKTLDRIFGDAVSSDASARIGTAPTAAIEGLAGRRGSAARVAMAGTSARQRRSRLCRASYLACATPDGDASAVTTATTVHQQASRAFAAEMLAPADVLRDLAGKEGLTPDKVEAYAYDAVCPERTVFWQAHNHGIPLRGFSG